jgi:choline dehydrogenase
MSEPLEFDTIIIGAGSAGCLLANRLSAQRGQRILLVEAGGEDDWFWIKIPVGYLFTIANPRTDWCFKTQPDQGLAGRSIHYARGRGLGGSSSINAMIYMRGQSYDYERWAQITGDERWHWAGEHGQTLSIYKHLENYFAGANEWHGTAGEIRVETPRVKWKILDAWQQAAREQGIPSIEEFNRGNNEGCAYFHVNQRSGRRWSMADAFLHPVRHRENLSVFTHTQTLQVLFEENRERRPSDQFAWANAGLRARGVRLLKDSQIIEARARKEVILSAGAIGSPHILQASGIGDPKHLGQFYIPVQQDLPGVGQNLQDHLQIRTIYKIKNARTVNSLYANPFSRIGMALQYGLFRRGPMTMPPSTLGAFTKSDPLQPSANLEWHVQPLSLPKFGEPLHEFDAITPSVCNLRPSSRGQVLLQHSDPLQAPAIHCNYLSTQEDLDVAVKGIAMTRDIMKSEALAGYNPEELFPGPQKVSQQELEQAARELGTTIFHPVGTCAMGRVSEEGASENPLTVIDTSFRLRGVAGLRVVDASAMPTITSGNTNAPVMLMAERAARDILSPR